MAQRVNYSGLVVAGIGFFLTRFTVTLAIYENPVRFYLAGIVPLTLGLGLAAFGVALAVADIDASVVRTVAVWCVIGALTMLVLVILTLLGSTVGEMPAFTTLQSRVYLSNFLIGGSVGGTLTGLYAALNRRQQVELERQANRLEVLNRILRHEVLNALTVIRGYAPEADSDPGAVELIQARSDDIEGIIGQVQYLAQSARAMPAATDVALGACLDQAVEEVASAHPDATIATGTVPRDLTVQANVRLVEVFTALLEHAVRRADGDNPGLEVSVEETLDTVRVTVEHVGPALASHQRALLETGEIGEYDDPSSGFELNVTRLLVESYQGSIETRREGDHNYVTVVLPRTGSSITGHGLVSAGVSGVRPAVPTLLVTTIAALVAGVAYGIASETLGGSIAGIGVFYGTASPVVGWITHEFHSVVFAFVYVGLVSLAPRRVQGRYGAHVAIGLGWGVALWVGAAGFVAPFWLRLLGIPAPLPSFSGPLLVAHLCWGSTLGLLTAWGYHHVSPRLERLSLPARLRPY